MFMSLVVQSSGESLERAWAGFLPNSAKKQEIFGGGVNKQIGV